MDNVTMCTDRWFKPGYSAILYVILGFLLISKPADARSSWMNISPTVQIAAQQLELSELYVSRSDTQAPKVTLSVENAPLIGVLHQLANELDVNISINPKNIEDARVTYQQRNKDLFEVLDDLLSRTPLTYTMSEDKRTLIIYEEEQQPSAFAQEIFDGSVTGTVTDTQTGDPLVGVNIVIAQMGIGTATDANGEFEIESLEEGEYEIVARYIGYRTLRETITVTDNEETVVNLEMSVSTSELSEVVVTALGITRDERSVGYSAQEVGGEDLTLSKEQNVIGSLSGKIAGVQISGSSGASLGGTQTIKIRGINSLSGEGQPLFVVDGTPISNGNFAGSAGTDYGNLAQDINPDDIESINVLKGPAASALYGIRGQYGVVMITTKKGQGREDFQVEVSSSVSMQRAANFMEFQNEFGAGYSLDFPTLPNGQPYVETYADESWGPRMDGTMVREYFSFYPQDPQYGQLTPFDPHPNNIKNYFETGYKSNQSISVSGGGENSNYRLSFNDARISGVSPNTWLNRNNLGISAGIDVSEQWRFSTNLNYATNSAQRPPQGSGYGSRHFRQWFQRSLDMGRLSDYQYDDGTFSHWNINIPDEGETPEPVYWSNPYFLAYENPTQDSRNRIFGDVGVDFDLLPNLTISGHIRGDMYIQNIESRTAVGGDSTPGYFVGKYENQEMNYEILAKYTENWSEFSLDATLGGNVFDSDYSYIRQETVGGLTSPGYYNIDASLDRPDPDNYLSEKRILSAFGLVSLGFQDTYFVDVSLRSDKSSTLPKDNNTYFYPSISGSLVFSELMDWEPLSFGKIRASYAQAGSDLGPYQTTPVYSIGTVYGSVNTLTVPNSINNPNIKPSFSHSYEAGLDLNFFGRLELNFTYYQQQNENQIIDLNISGASGYNSATINAGLIENKGVELSISGTPIQNQNFTWESTFNFGKNINEVVELHPDIDVYTHGSTVYSGTASYMNSYEGEAYGRLVGQAYERDEATGKILLDDNNMPIWTDATHDFGSVLPDFTGGLLNVVNYKNFSLGAMIDFQAGGQFFSRSLLLAVKTGLAPITAETNDKGNNVRLPVSEGGGVKINGISESTGEEITTYVDAQGLYNGILGDDIYEDWVVDASYIKLREVRLGYTFGADILGNLPVSSIEVAAYANNPIMIWQNAPDGLDPSELSSGSQDLTWYESGQLNTVRTFGLNVNLIF